MRAKYVSGPRLSATTGSTFELQLSQPFVGKKPHLAAKK